MKHLFRILSICFLSVLLAGSVKVYSTNNNQKHLREVTLQLKWKHQFQFAGYYAAIEKGFYKEEGLSVNLQEAEEGKDPVMSVFSGKAEFGTSTSGIVITRDEGFPAVVLASVFQHSPQVLIASKETNIQYVQDLLGKKIMIEPHAADIVTYMRDEGVLLEDCQVLDHTFNVKALIENEVAALTGYNTDEPFLLQQAGFDYIIISPINGGIDFYGDVLFTSELMIEKDKELVDRFVKASLKGWRYAMGNSEELIDIIYSKYSQRHSKEHLRFEAEQMQRLILPEVVEIGYSNTGRWKRIISTYRKSGFIGKNVNAELLIYAPKKSDTPFPWRLTFIYSLISILVGAAAYFYYSVSKSLQKEIYEKGKVQDELRKSESRYRELNSTKDKYFSIISHDLKNPFNAIQGLSELLMNNLDEYSPDKKRNYLRIINETSAQAFELLENMLIWSNTQIDRIEFNPQVIDLKDLIEHNIKLVCSQAKRKQIFLDSVINGDSVVFGDKHMINTILRNLLSNAVKFTKDGGRVTLFLESTEKEIKIIVHDNGVGISQDNIEKLFVLDGKFQTPGTANEIGSGIGLILCNEFVKKHCGTMNIESELNKGSRFSFVLPRFNLNPE